MTITAEEFIRRFLLHVLPNNFTKIKHYGLLTNRNKKSNIILSFDIATLKEYLPTYSITFSAFPLGC